MNARVAGFPGAGAGDRRERSEENWVRQKKQFSVPARPEAVGASKSGSTRKCQEPAGDQSHGRLARLLEARNEQKWVHQKKPAPVRPFS